MKIIRGIAYSAVGLIVVALVSVNAWYYIMGSHTKYCPWSHRMNDLSVCFVLDETEERALIQHGDLDSNWYYLEIREKETSEEYEFPEFIRKVGENDYSAKLIKGNKKEILINGEKFKLKKHKDT